MLGAAVGYADEVLVWPGGGEGKSGGLEGRRVGDEGRDMDGLHVDDLREEGTNRRGIVVLTNLNQRYIWPS